MSARTTSRLGYAAIAIAVVIAIAGGFLSGYGQQVALAVMAAVLGLGLVILFVNSILNSSEKREAAQPLMQMIQPYVVRLHNDFVRKGRDRFGIEGFATLLNLYTRNSRKPEAFSLEDRERLYVYVAEQRQELTGYYDILQDQLRELTTIAGWSFDPTIVASALSARLSIATFKALKWDNMDDKSKLKAVESYLDIEAETSAVFRKLVLYLGLKDEDWQLDA